LQKQPQTQLIKAELGEVIERWLVSLGGEC
jgi:hypothetical protein